MLADPATLVSLTSKSRTSRADRGDACPCDARAVPTPNARLFDGKVHADHVPRQQAVYSRTVRWRSGMALPTNTKSTGP